jgi:hypothetical protein
VTSKTTTLLILIVKFKYSRVAALAAGMCGLPGGNPRLTDQGLERHKRPETFTYHIASLSELTQCVVRFTTCAIVFPDIIAGDSKREKERKKERERHKEREREREREREK